MTPHTHIFHPVISSPGPDGGMIALAFSTVDAELTLRAADKGEVLEDHLAQRVVTSFLEARGIRDRIAVETTLSERDQADDVWRIPSAVAALAALRDALPGLAEVLWPAQILAHLQEIKVARVMRDGHRVRAALDGGAHARVDYDGGTIDFDVPEAAIVWIRVPLDADPKLWTQAQTSKISVKRANAAAEQCAAALLRAAFNDSIALFQAWESAAPPEALLAGFPGWIPAQNAARAAAPHARIGLVGTGPDMLIASHHEAIAAAAAQAALTTFEAHALECDVHAWSNLNEDEDLQE